MDNLTLKKKLIEACEKIQKERIEAIQSAMDEAQQSANEYGGPKDRYDSFRMQQLNKKDMFASQWQKANSEFIALEKINDLKGIKKVEFGAVVITAEQKLFISISLGKVEVEDESFFAISPNVPIFEAMKGLKKNDTFTFRDKKIKILDVF
jgi:hypothetical protein